MNWREPLSAAGMPIRQRGTLFALTRAAALRLKESHGNAGRRSAWSHSADTMQQSAVCHSSQAWPKLRHPGKKRSTSTSLHADLIGLAHFWLIAIINKTYGCLKSNHWGNNPVNDLTPHSKACGCWINGSNCLPRMSTTYNSQHLNYFFIIFLHVYYLVSTAFRGKNGIFKWEEQEKKGIRSMST